MGYEFYLIWFGVASTLHVMIDGNLAKLFELGYHRLAEDPELVKQLISYTWFTICLGRVGYQWYNGNGNVGGNFGDLGNNDAPLTVDQMWKRIAQLSTIRDARQEAEEKAKFEVSTYITDDVTDWLEVLDVHKNPDPFLDIKTFSDEENWNCDIKSKTLAKCVAKCIVKSCIF